MISGKLVRGAILLAIVAGTFFVGAFIFEKAPKSRRLTSLMIEPSAGDVVVGRRELGQRAGFRSAARNHLRLVFEHDTWKVADIAPDRNVDLRFEDGSYRRLGRWEIREGDLVTVGSIRLEAVKVEPGLLVFKRWKGSADAGGVGDVVVWREGRLFFSDERSVYDGYYTLESRLAAAVRTWTREAGWSKDREDFLFSIGGSIDGPDRLRLEGVPPGAANVYCSGDRFFLSRGRSRARIEMRRKHGPTLRFEALFVSIEPNNRYEEGYLGEGRVEAVVVGQTYYAVAIDQNRRLVFTPERNIDLRYETESDGETVREPTQTDESYRRGVKSTFVEIPVRFGEGESLLAWALRRIREIAGAFLATVAVCASLAFYRKRGNGRRKTSAPALFAAVFPAAAALFLFPLLWQDRARLDLAHLAVVAWSGWAWSALLFGRKGTGGGALSRLVCSAYFLAGFGALVLLQLAAGAENTRWVDAFCKHALILLPAGFFAGVAAVIEPASLYGIWADISGNERRIWPVARIGIAAAGTALVGAQLVFGNEQGLWGVQPSELAKFLLAATAAFVGMDLAELWRMNPRHFQQSPWPAVWGFLKTLFVVGFAVVATLAGVRDISPILIMAIFFLAWMWAVAPSNPRRHPGLTWGKIVRFAVVGAVCLATASAAYVRSRPEFLPKSFPQRDRFLVWAAPDAHPYSGEQAIKAMSLAGKGGWTGAGEELFSANGPIMNLPMVRNDFIASFVLYKFGAVAGLLLLLSQAVYVRALFDAGSLAGSWSGDFKARQAGEILHLFLYGLAWMHVAHFAISWANALGLLPVMGQPMTWLSSANSHMIFFGLPAFFLALVACIPAPFPENRADGKNAALRR